MERSGAEEPGNHGPVYGSTLQIDAFLPSDRSHTAEKSMLARLGEISGLVVWCRLRRAP